HLTAARRSERVTAARGRGLDRSSCDLPSERVGGHHGLDARGPEGEGHGVQPMSEEKETITIPVARLRRLIEALSYASVEALEEAQGLLGAPMEDDFGELEGIFGVFLKEL